MGIVRNYNGKAIAILLAAVLLLCMLPFTAFATAPKTEISGKVFEFGKDSSYEFSNSESFSETTSDNTYGTFSIGGNIANVSNRDGVTAYEISDGNIAFFYNHSDSKLKADVDSWHLIDDKSKKINDVQLNTNIMKGAIIVQTSKDRLNWLNAITITNAFRETPVRTNSIYTTEDIQLINGCFYRVIIVYELRIRTKDSNFLFINTDKYDYKKFAEVYEFYAHRDSEQSSSDVQSTPYELGKRVRVADFENYSGEQPIDANDPHKDWDLGQFYVSGYTSDRTHEDDGLVFLKNVGDKITLSFKLKENINCLRGNNDLFISADTDGYDQHFEKGPMNFEKGALFIKYTDRNNKSTITTYTNFLEANTSVTADTIVDLFEEGDYEVALDYEITNDLLIDKVYHYRIFFKFAVRNSNCMVFPIDVGTGSELTNSSMTENGFRLDLAKSKYLDINLKREVLRESADGMVEDTRFNGAARDGAEYTEEGIYTITVSNRYTKEFTVKKIYVGTNNILKAHITTGLSIPEINNLVAEGATISNDGLITLASSTPPDTAPTDNSTTPENQGQSGQDDVTDNTPNNSPVIYIIIGVIIVTAVCLLIFRKRLIKSVPIINNLEKGDDEQ